MRSISAHLPAFIIMPGLLSARTGVLAAFIATLAILYPFLGNYLEYAYPRLWK